MIKYKKAITSFFVLLLLLAIGLGLPHLDQSDIDTSNYTPLKVASPLLDASLLNLVAEHEGFFSGQQLSVDLKRTEPGNAAMEMLLESAVDIAIVPDSTIAKKIYNGDSFIILSTLHYATGNVQLLFSNENEGTVTKMADIRGKRIGVISDDVGETFVNSILDHMSIPLTEVTFVYGERSDLIRKLENNEIDGIALRRIFIHDLEKRYKNSFVTSGKNNYFATYNVVSTKDFVDQHGDVVNRYYAALENSEDFYSENKKTVIKLLSKELNLDKSFIKGVVEQSEYKITNDNTLQLLISSELEYLNKKNNTTYKFDLQKYFDSSFTRGN